MGSGGLSNARYGVGDGVPIGRFAGDGGEKPGWETPRGPPHPVSVPPWGLGDVCGDGRQGESRGQALGSRSAPFICSAEADGGVGFHADVDPGPKMSDLAQ